MDESLRLIDRLNLDLAIADQNAQDSYDYYTHVFIGGNEGVIFKIHNS